MKLHYDATADALSLQLTGGKGRKVTTKEITPDVFLDFDSTGKLVALELLNASDHVPEAALKEIGLTPDPMTLGELEKEFGLSATSWRGMLNTGRVQGQKTGTTWTVDRTDAVNYMASRKASGRPALKRKARRPKVKA